MSLRNALLIAEIKPVVEGLAVRHPVEDLSADEAIEAWVILDRLETLVATRKAQLRERLFQVAEQLGTTNESGHYKLFVGGHEVTKQRSQKNVPDRAEFLSLIASKGIKEAEVLDKIETTELNPSKIAYLVKTGKLTQEEVDQLRKVEWRLRVDPGKEFRTAVETLTAPGPALKKFVKRG